MTGGWEFWVDRGGTFTDVVARRPDGRLITDKLLSHDPDRYQDAAMAGIRRLMDVAEGPLPAHLIRSVKMGTTVATNALLERKGEPTVLAITTGFADALRIGYQNRPRLFDRHIVLPDLLYGRAIEIDERVGPGGQIVRPLDLDRAAEDLEGAFAQGFRALALALMHGYRFPAHEGQIGDLARRIGFTQVSVSHEVSALVKLIARADTTVADAYLSPGLASYVNRVAAELGPDVPLQFMQSNGGLVSARRFRGRDAILSGPAGGIVGMARTAMAAGFAQVIGFDMGGTSTDVSHYAGEFERTSDSMVAGVRIRAPMMDIHTVAAGGGSVCRFDGAKLLVGPLSAGADPGPACYRRGGPLTITDCNVLLGKIQPSLFPNLFGPEGDQPLALDVVVRGFDELAQAVRRDTGRRVSAPELAEGFLTIAVESMASAIRHISVQRGHDPADHVLACFGGAAGQHACLVADALGMSRVMVHPLAGVLSAYGIGLAELRELREATVEARLGPDLQPTLLKRAGDLERDAREALTGQGGRLQEVVAATHVSLKYEGTDTGLRTPLSSVAAMRGAFEAMHLRRFGYLAPEREVIVETVSVEATGMGADQHLETTLHGSPTADPATKASVWMAGGARDTPIHPRSGLGPGARLAGPAIISDPSSTTVVEPGWGLRVDALGNLILERTEPLPTRMATGADVDPVRLEVFNNLFIAIAEQMGFALQNTASSVNIKERLDFSCALFDPDGALIANAPHIPVHLGSMGEGVKTVIASRRGARDGRRMHPGDAYVLNAPYNGGTHLPDITVIMPVFDPAADATAAASGAPWFYLAARGHHADVGGSTPGSMPPHSRTILEEGVLIDDVLLVDAGRFCETELRAMLASGPYPARNIDQNIADLRAQIAACATGAEQLLAAVDRYGVEVVHAYMAHVQDNAEEEVRRIISRLSSGRFEYGMDNGAVVKVEVSIDANARTAIVDFTGTSGQLDDNFNAPFSVCRAAVLYVFRTLVDHDIPMNDGCLRPVRIIAPNRSMLRPSYPAAVVAGNVETSQVITDALYGALGVLAAAQGTMNNFTFGDERSQYYETICGGSGAGPNFHGADAVQTHMTNSRLTDPEVLEQRFPVLLERFAIRRGSGGAGRWHGGDGVSRRLRFTEPMHAAILAGRRRIAPFGLEGGDSGALGRSYVERADGRLEALASTDEADMAVGDAFVIETPGGGGFGRRDA